MDEAREDAVLRAAALIGSRVPMDAVPLLRDGVAALSWRASGGARVLHTDRGGRMLLAVHRREELPSEDAILELARNETPCGTSAASLLRLSSPGHGGDDPLGPPERRAVLVALARSVDTHAWIAMVEYGYTGNEVMEWLTDASDDGRRDFVRAHPWLVGPLSNGRHRYDFSALRMDPATALAAALRGVIGRQPTDAETEASARLGAFAYPQGSIGDPTAEHVRALAQVPADLFPPAVLPGTPVSDPVQQGTLAFLCLAPPLAILAALVDRPVRSLSGRPGDWGAYVADLAAQAGLHDAPDDFPGDWGAILANDAMSEIFDMARAFASEVLSPALILGGRPGWTGPIAEGRAARSVQTAELDATMRAALRLLLGDRTLRRLAETCGRWHARADGIAREVAALAGDAAPRGPRLFPDLDLGDCHYLTSLHTVPDLLAEGSPGEDANGVRGLHHCVGGYGREVASGSTAIVSLRRRTAAGYERIGTAEVNFAGTGTAAVLQHRGRRNARPGAESTALMALGIATVTDEARANLAAFVPAPGGWGRTDELVARSGAWDAIRDLWSFALPRPLRTLDPAGMLAAAGLDCAPTPYPPALRS